MWALRSGMCPSINRIERNYVLHVSGTAPMKNNAFELYNATATFQQLMGQAPTNVTKKFVNFIICHFDDVYRDWTKSSFA